MKKFFIKKKKAEEKAIKKNEKIKKKNKKNKDNNKNSVEKNKKKVKIGVNGIGFKINMAFIASMIGVGVALSSILIPFMTGQMRETIEDQSLMIAEGQVQSIDTYIENTKAQMNFMGDGMKFEELENIPDLYTKMKGSNSKFLHAFVIDGETGIETMSSGYDTSLDDRSKQDIFKKVTDKDFVNKSVVASGKVKKVEFNMTGETFIFELMRPVVNSSFKAEGVIGTKIDMESMWNDIRGEKIIDDENKEAIKEFNTGQKIYIVSEDGYVLASDNMTWVKNQKNEEGSYTKLAEKHNGFNALQAKMKNSENDEEIKIVGSYNNYNGEEVLSSMVYSPKLGMAVVVDTPKEVAFSSISMMNKVIMGIIFVSLVAVIIFGFFFAKKLTNPLKKLMSVALDVSHGDLTKRSSINRKDEIGELAKSFDNMVANLSQIVENTQGASVLTFDTSKDLKEVANEVAYSSSQVTEAINEIAKGAEHQATISQETDDKINQFLEIANQLDDQNDEVINNAVKTQKIIYSNQEIIEALIKGVHGLSEVSSESSKEVKKLEESAKQISSIVESTNDISKQTNLLALNAAIEAARAGEHGKGFAVVAGEVKKLAEESQSESSKIEKIIEEVMGLIGNVSDKMEGSIDKAKKESESAEKAKEALLSIVVSMDKVLESVESMDKFFEEQKKYVETIQSRSKEASSVAIETSSGAEEVSASSTQTQQSMKQVIGKIDSLLGMATDLKQSVDKFKVEAKKINEEEDKK